MENQICEGPITRNVGWICPKCGASVAPNVEVCPNCNGRCIHVKVDNGTTSCTNCEDLDGEVQMILS